MKMSAQILCVCLLASSGGRARSQEPEKIKDRPQAEKAAWLHKNYLGDASEYELFLDQSKRKKLELRPEAAMRWRSSEDFDGEVYVWTHQGAAAVVGCIFSGPQGVGRRAVFHEFHSLSPEPLHAAGGGASGWRAQEPGIKLEPLPDAPEPAANRALRLAQMREAARRFTAHVDRDDGKSEMRLLPQPIYRYEISDETSPVVDGAVFAFVWTAGTDPELMLVIEARRTSQGVRWQYAPARFTNREAWLQHQGKEVWRASRAEQGIFDGVTTKRYGVFSVKTIAETDETR
ncbi:MAG: hypothetical protein P4L85_24060 [Paludisphaera borealis]|uniref:hypothetical protein n=1 Tax=Paludisphaera borealis TaxID=1387353 RepID=UPI00284051BB|nr:hypothetical protein [Paludisphaera borealis]MDR3622447.1 hypothetical protein [Paludisphaera borealis]